jgi:hypothetical protein
VHRENILQNGVQLHDFAADIRLFKQEAPGAVASFGTGGELLRHDASVTSFLLVC